MRAGVFAAVLVIGLAIPALASGGATAAPAGEKTVEMINVKFSPASVVINKGDKVIFVNKDTFCHDVEIENLGNSGAVCGMNTSASWSWVFESVGTFKYRCRAHSTDFNSGMVGTVIVQDPNAPPPQKTPGFELVALAAALAAASALFIFVSRRRGA